MRSDIGEEWRPRRAKLIVETNADLGARLEADCSFANDADWQALLKDFGKDLIRKEGDKIAFKGNVIRDRIEAGKPFRIELGRPSPDLLSKLPAPPAGAEHRPLTVTQGWLDRKRADGTDHRAHFGFIPEHPDDIPLAPSDVDLIPVIWRSPDRVLPDPEGDADARLLEMDALAGGTYRMIVRFGAKKTKMHTFYRTGPLN